MTEGWEAFVSERPLGVLATIGPDGIPHAVTVEVVPRDGRVWAWVESGSVKGRNVRRDQRAAMCVYKGHHGVLVRGPARLVAKGEPGYDEIAQAFLDKYDREETYGNDLLIGIEPARVTTW